jgi:hypothetical protein
VFADELRRAAQAAPKNALHDVARMLWRAFANGQVTEDEAEEIGQAIELRKAVPAIAGNPGIKRRTGSRPRSPESMERRRRWVASGRVPPQLAARFTMGEGAVLAVVALEVAKRGDCRLTIPHIAALAGVSETTVRNAMRQAEALGLLRVEERRLTAWRNHPNVVRIVSAEWRSWLRLRPPSDLRSLNLGTATTRSAGGGCNTVNPTGTKTNNYPRARPNAPSRHSEKGRGRL